MIGIPLLLALVVPAEEPVKPVFPLGKETTYVTGPLDKDGYIDYAAALNERLGKGVTPETNAVVLIWKTTGPRPHDDDRMPAKYFSALRVKEPPEQGDYWVSTKALWKMDGPDLDAAFEQIGAAMRRPWQSKDYPRVNEWLTANEKPLSVFVAASRLPRYFNPIIPEDAQNGRGFLFDSRLACVHSCREAGAALTARALLRLGEGRYDDAWEDLLACHRLARLIGSGGSLLEGLVGIALEIMASTADLAYIERAPLTPLQIRARIKDLDGLPHSSSAADKIDVSERVDMLDVLQHVRREGPASLKRLGRDWEQTNPGLLATAMAALNWEPPLRNVNRWFDRVTIALRTVDRPTREKELARLDEELLTLRKASESGDKPPTGETIGNVIIPLFMPGFQKVKSAEDRCEQVRCNLHIAFALAAYRADNGRYPAKLDDLAPKYLATIPADLFSGKPLIFRPTEKGYILYSVGPNGIDDGGQLATDDPPGDDLGVRMPLPDLKPKK